MVTRLHLVHFLAHSRSQDLGLVGDSSLFNLGLLHLPHLSSSELAPPTAASPTLSDQLFNYLDWSTATVLDAVCRMQKTNESIIPLVDSSTCELRDFITAGDLRRIFETRELGAFFLLAKDYLVPLRKEVVEQVERRQHFAVHDIDRDRNIIYQAQLHSLRKEGQTAFLPSSKATAGLKPLPPGPKP